jgi:hypothetical protein
LPELLDICIQSLFHRMRSIPAQTVHLLVQTIPFVNPGLQGTSDFAAVALDGTAPCALTSTRLLALSRQPPRTTRRSTDCNRLHTRDGMGQDAASFGYQYLIVKERKYLSPSLLVDVSLSAVLRGANQSARGDSSALRPHIDN